MDDGILPRDIRGNPVTVGLPMAMLAELTHRCPLACPYCSNPVELARATSELTAAEWADAFRQAAALGVLQVHLSGGEPASRRDLAEIARSAGFEAEPRGELASATWEGIVGVADELDAAVIVIGSRGLTGMKKIFDTSVSQQLAEHAGRPVLIVPPLS